MKKVMAAIGLLALASTSHAVTTLGLDAECNGNGESLGFIPFNGTFYLGCELPTPIVVDDTVILAKESATFGTDIVWTLPAIVVVGNGSVDRPGFPASEATPENVDHTVLEIEAGAQIAGAVNSASALLISRGASINAVGAREEEDEQGNPITVVDPIVFSSLDDNYNGSGEWGGLVLAGFAQANECPNVTGGAGGCEMEGVAPGHYFGGGLADSVSNSTLKYVVIAEGGHVITDGNEINGLTLYGTSNSNASIMDVHVHNNADDGIEFFGGDVDVSNLKLTCNEDDSVDWDYGYTGDISNVMITQYDNAGHVFELANNPNNHNASPRSGTGGLVKDVTVEFVGSTAPASVPFRLKEGTNASFQNVVLGSDYDSISCDNVTNPGPTISFDETEYGCTPVSIPAEDPPATGSSYAGFWSAPACD